MPHSRSIDFLVLRLAYLAAPDHPQSDRRMAGPHRVDRLWGFRLRDFLALDRFLNQFSDGPNVVRHSKLHRGRTAQRFVDAAEVIEANP